MGDSDRTPWDRRWLGAPRSWTWDHHRDHQCPHRNLSVRRPARLHGANTSGTTLDEAKRRLTCRPRSTTANARLGSCSGRLWPSYPATSPEHPATFEPRRNVAPFQLVAKRVSSCQLRLRGVVYGEARHGRCRHLGYEFSNDGVSTIFTTALDVTASGDDVGAWFIIDTCNTTNPAPRPLLRGLNLRPHLTGLRP